MAPRGPSPWSHGVALAASIGGHVGLVVWLPVFVAPVSEALPLTVTIVEPETIEPATVEPEPPEAAVAVVTETTLGEEVEEIAGEETEDVAEEQPDVAIVEAATLPPEEQVLAARLLRAALGAQAAAAKVDADLQRNDGAELDRRMAETLAALRTVEAELRSAAEAMEPRTARETRERSARSVVAEPHREKSVAAKSADPRQIGETPAGGAPANPVADEHAPGAVVPEKHAPAVRAANPVPNEPAPRAVAEKHVPEKHAPAVTAANPVPDDPEKPAPVTPVKHSRVPVVEKSDRAAAVGRPVAEKPIPEKPGPAVTTANPAADEHAPVAAAERPIPEKHAPAVPAANPVVEEPAPATVAAKPVPRDPIPEKPAPPSPPSERKPPSRVGQPMPTAPPPVRAARAPVPPPPAREALRTASRDAADAARDAADAALRARTALLHRPRDVVERSVPAQPRTAARPEAATPSPSRPPIRVTAPLPTSRPDVIPVETPDPGAESGSAPTTAGSSWFRYVRTDDATAARNALADDAAIGGTTTVAAPTARAVTNTRRSFGNGRADDEAVPAPDEAPPAARTVVTEAIDRLATPADAESTGPLAMLPDDWAPVERRRPRKARKSAPITSPLPMEAAVAGTAGQPGADVETTLSLSLAALDGDGFFSPPPEIVDREAPAAAPEVEPAPEMAIRAARKDGAAWSSLTVLGRDAKEGARAHANVRQHVLGEWMDGVDASLRATWTYPPELRALGVHGEVTLQFLVRANGRVADIVILSSSGDARLDERAVAAVPSRTPPLPFGYTAQWVRYTFRYAAAGTTLP